MKKLIKPKKPKEPKFFLEKPQREIGGFNIIDHEEIVTVQDLLDQMPEGIDYNFIKLNLYSDDGPVDITIDFPAQKNINYKKEKELFDRRKAKHKDLHDKWKESIKDFEIKNKQYEMEKLKEKLDKLEKENSKK